MINVWTISYYFLVLQPSSGVSGSYRNWKVCPKFSYASGFEPKIRECCGGDATGLNDVKLHCSDPNGTPTLVDSSVSNLVSL